MGSHQRVLLLCYRVARGYGVDAVVLEHARGLRELGHEVHIVCVEKAASQTDKFVQTIIPASKVFQEFLKTFRPTHVIAHTEPWMSLLAEVRERNFAAYVWEHGDPTPELIPSQTTQRQAEKDHKLMNVYPRVDQVFAISEFVRSDIRWPLAQVVYNGLDRKLLSMEVRLCRSSADRLKVGTLMRLGQGEAQYKGAAIFLSLVDRLRSGDAPIDFFLMGKGNEKDAESYRSQGIAVHLNASEIEKKEYLQGLDLFVSPSLWEGFNLPLVEAQTVGTPALAFDVGSHPEVTPLIFSTLDEMVGFLRSVSSSPALLDPHAQNARKFVERRFSYSVAISAIESTMSGQPRTLQPQMQVSWRRLFVLGVAEGIANKGYWGFGLWFLKKTLRRVLGKI